MRQLSQRETTNDIKLVCLLVEMELVHFSRASYSTYKHLQYQTSLSNNKFKLQLRQDSCKLIMMSDWGMWKMTSHFSQCGLPESCSATQLCWAAARDLHCKCIYVSSFRIIPSGVRGSKLLGGLHNYNVMRFIITNNQCAVTNWVSEQLQACNWDKTAAN